MLLITNLTTGNLDLGGSIVLAPGAFNNTLTVITASMTAAQLAGKLSISGTEGSAPVTQAVTQLTSAATGVTLNSPRGLVTTFAASAAADATHRFTVTNTFAGIGSNIRTYIVNYAGTTGNPSVTCDNRAAGAFDIVVTNNHSSAALNGALTIGFEIVN